MKNWTFENKHNCKLGYTRRLRVLDRADEIIRNLLHHCNCMLADDCSELYNCGDGVYGVGAVLIVNVVEKTFCPKTKTFNEDDIEKAVKSLYHDDLYW